MRHRASRPMPKSKEAKARAAKALKEKRHRLKAEQKVKAQEDAKGEVACEDCKKHIVAVISANLHIDRLKQLCWPHACVPFPHRPASRDTAFSRCVPLLWVLMWTRWLAAALSLRVLHIERLRSVP